MMPSTVPPVLADAVQRELMGERVLWGDTPSPWGYASAFWKNALIGIPFTAFAVFWTTGASSIPRHARPRADADAPAFFSHMPDFFLLWGLMFIGFGLSMLLQPLYRAWLAGRIYYAVTERRAVIFTRFVKTTIQAFDANTLDRYERTSSGGPGGKIVFERVNSRTWNNRTTTEVGFLGLRDYAPAEQALRRLVVGRAARP